MSDASTHTGVTPIVPTLPADVDALRAAIMYAECGWYVVPVRRGTKHPGSVLGQQWPSRSTRDPQQIAAWWAGTDHGIALHAGRSGAVIVDVDHPEAVPPVLAEALRAAPYQATRTDAPGRGHYVFGMPEGRAISNAVGELGKGWGEIRGRNGVIIVAPSVHPEEVSGGLYRWERAGRAPVLPPAIATMLPDSATPEDAVSEAEIGRFLDQYSSGSRLDLPAHVVEWYRAAVAAGASRHETGVGAACWVLREARAGLYPARQALSMVYAAFRDSLRMDPQRDPRAEWTGIVAWALGQAAAADPGEIRDRVLGGDPYAELPDVGFDPFSDENIEILRSSPGETAGQGRPPIAERFLDSDGLDSIPDPVPLIDGILFRNEMARVIGASGSMKSFVLLDMAARIAAGEPWHGRETTRGEVLVIVAEGAAGTRKRVRAWEKHHGRKMAGVRFLPEPLQIAVRDPERRELVASPDWIELYRYALYLRPALIIIDTQARAALGVSENDNTEMGILYAIAEKMQKGTGAAVVLVHHTPKGDGEEGRGAGAIRGALTTELLVRKTKEAGGRECIRLVSRKQKDAAEADEIVMTPVIVDLGLDRNGRPQDSVVLTVDPFASAVSVESSIANAMEVEEGVSHLTKLLIVISKLSAQPDPDGTQRGAGFTKAEVAGMVKKITAAKGGKWMSPATTYRMWDTAVAQELIAKTEGQRWQLTADGWTVARGGVVIEPEKPDERTVNPVKINGTASHVDEVGPLSIFDQVSQMLGQNGVSAGQVP